MNSTELLALGYGSFSDIDTAIGVVRLLEKSIVDSLGNHWVLHIGHRLFYLEANK